MRPFFNKVTEHESDLVRLVQKNQTSGNARPIRALVIPPEADGSLPAPSQDEPPPTPAAASEASGAQPAGACYSA